MPNAGEQLNSEIAALVKQDAEHGESLGVLTDQLVLTNRRVAALEQRVAALESAPPPVTEPPPVPPVNPGEPPVFAVIAPADPAKRGDGVKNKSLSNAWVRGHSQNIVVDAPGSYTFDTGISSDAWRRVMTDGKLHPYEGQGIYAAGDNDIVVRNFYFGQNGWQKGRDGYLKDMYRHGAYINNGKSIRFEHCIFDENCSQGLKLMRNSVLRNCFVYRNPLGISTIYGNHDFAEVTIYGGGYYFDGTNWTSNTALSFYAPTKLDDVWVVGMPDAMLYVAPRQKPTGRFNMGAILGDNWHQQYNETVIKDRATGEKYANVPGSSVTAANCVLAGWQGAKFDGKAKHDGSGFRQFDSPVSVDVEPILKPMREGRVAVTAERVRQVSRLVRGKVE